jgi:nucleoside-diphosphate-sugar epimerase
MPAPMPSLIDDYKKINGDIIVLGVGGKMGPTLARMAKRAAPDKRVVGVARFSEKGLRESLTKHGIECIEADLLSREKVAALPKMKNVIFMAGRKFGSTGYEDLTWAMNAYVPALVAEHFTGSRIVAFSTGNVYPWVNVAEGGAGEDTPAIPPSGTYANSCAARENIFQYFSRTTNTPGRIIRLNYAIDMRYGVLHDVASKVIVGKPINLEAGHVNVIWQGDANAQILRTLLHCTVPSSPINISGPEHISVRWLAKEFARRFDKPVTFEATESPRGWLTNTTLANGLFGYPSVPLHRMIDWVADWVKRDMPSLGKETHYDSRDGTF